MMQSDIDPVPALERECLALFDAYNAACGARERAEGTRRAVRLQAAEDAASEAFDAAVARVAATPAAS